MFARFLRSAELLRSPVAVSMSTSAVSVVIPCYNQGRFLGEALDSVFEQSRPADQVIVVDDGSSDETPAVAARYRDLTYVRQDNLGLAHARNRGLDEASGQFVVFLDADDRLRRDALAIGLEASARHRDCAFVFGRCERMDEQGAPLPTGQLPLIDGNHYTALLQRNHIWTPAVAVFNRAVSGRLLRFDPTVDPAADYDLYLRIARERRIAGHGQVVADYRLHDRNMSRNAALMLEATIAVLYMQRPYVINRPEYDAAWRSGLRAWRAYYGDALVDGMRGFARHPRRWGAFTESLRALLRYAPGDAWRHARRKMVRLVGGLPPDPSRAEPPETGATRKSVS